MEELIGEICKIVQGHYEKSSAPFWLAQLGATLHDRNLWPPPDKSQGKNLRDFIQKAANRNVQIVRDPNIPLRLAVSDEAHIEQVKQHLVKSRAKDEKLDLKRIPRAILVAFCVSPETSSSVFLKKSPPHFFVVQRPNEQDSRDFWEIKADFRLSNLRLTDPQKLSDLDRARLEERILSWCAEVGVDPADLQQKTRPHGSALTRLVNAQTEEVRKQLVIPADIAILLSQSE